MLKIVLRSWLKAGNKMLMWFWTCISPCHEVIGITSLPLKPIIHIHRTLICCGKVLENRVEVLIDNRWSNWVIMDLYFALSWRYWIVTRIVDHIISLSLSTEHFISILRWNVGVNIAGKIVLVVIKFGCPSSLVTNRLDSNTHQRLFYLPLSTEHFISVQRWNVVMNNAENIMLVVIILGCFFSLVVFFVTNRLDSKRH